MNEPSIQDQIDEIMDHFDFHKVQRVMEHLEWKWEGKETPSVPEIRQKARYLLNKVVEEDLRYTAMGGLRAEFWSGYLRLSFEVESWDTGG